MELGELLREAAHAADIQECRIYDLEQKLVWQNTLLRNIAQEINDYVNNAGKYMH